MTRAAVGSDDAFFFRLREHVHYAAKARSPVALCQAVHEADVEIVGIQLAAEAVEIGTRRLRIACPGLCHYRDLVPRNMAKRISHVRVTPVGIRSVQEAQAMIVAIQQELGESLNSQRALVRGVSVSNGARSHCQTAGLDSCLEIGRA